MKGAGGAWQGAPGTLSMHHPDATQVPFLQLRPEMGRRGETQPTDTGTTERALLEPGGPPGGSAGLGLAGVGVGGWLGLLLSAGMWRGPRVGGHWALPCPPGAPAPTSRPAWAPFPSSHQGHRWAPRHPQRAEPGTEGLRGAGRIWGGRQAPLPALGLTLALKTLIFGRPVHSPSLPPTG